MQRELELNRNETRTPGECERLFFVPAGSLFAIWRGERVILCER